MSVTERDRLEATGRVRWKELTVVAAAELLEVSRGRTEGDITNPVRHAVRTIA